MFRVAPRKTPDGTRRRKTTRSYGSCAMAESNEAPIGETTGSLRRGCREEKDVIRKGNFHALEVRAEAIEGGIRELKIESGMMREKRS